MVLGASLRAPGAEITTEIFEVEEWEHYSLYVRYIEFPLSIHDGINPSSIDSVTVTISGIANQGSFTLSQGPQSYSVDCWDGLLARFDQSCSGWWCDWNTFSPDGITDYVAGSYVPSGDNEPFEVTVPIQGLERSDCSNLDYTVTEARPDFESIFSEENVYIRLSQVNGAFIGNLRCLGGLATIESISVSIIHGGGVSSEGHTWGSLKAQYR